MSERNGKKFVGAYVEADTKNKLQKLAQAADRPMNYIIKKILAEGVKHQTAKAA